MAQFQVEILAAPMSLTNVQADNTEEHNTVIFKGRRLPSILSAQPSADQLHGWCPWPMIQCRTLAIVKGRYCMMRVKAMSIRELRAEDL